MLRSPRHPANLPVRAKQSHLSALPPLPQSVKSKSLRLFNATWKRPSPSLTPPNMVQNARNPQIIAWNTHGLTPPRLAALELYLSMTRPVAVALSEIRLSPLSRHPAIPAYSCLFKRVSSASAGTAFLVAKSHRGQPIFSSSRRLRIVQACGLC